VKHATAHPTAWPKHTDPGNATVEVQNLVSAESASFVHQFKTHRAKVVNRKNFLNLNALLQSILLNRTTDFKRLEEKVESTLTLNLPAKTCSVLESLLGFDFEELTKPPEQSFSQMVKQVADELEFRMDGKKASLTNRDADGNEDGDNSLANDTDQDLDQEQELDD